MPLNWDEIMRKEKTKIIHGQEYKLFKKQFIERLTYKEDHALQTAMEEDMNRSYDSD